MLSHLEPRNLVLDIVVKLTETGGVTGVQRAQLALEDSFVQDLADANTPARSLVTVARADTLTRGANLAATQLSLLQTVHDGVQVEADVGTVRDEDTLSSALQTLLLEGAQLLEEAGDVEDGSRADQVDTRGGDQAGGQDVEVVSLRAVNDGMTRI